MANTRRFSDLRDKARSDPNRAKRIDAAKALALVEQAEYRVSELRRALGLTQAELAHLIGKSQSAISQIETGEISVSLDLLRTIISKLGGSLEVAAVFEERRVLLDT